MWAAEIERVIQLGSISAEDCIVRDLLGRKFKQITLAKKSVYIEQVWIKKLDRSWLENI